jgi:RHH-type proline utilization regulon transcriptional repressor/proline dehydrogenase/delta 1-pyrroline-5-carboxylate dehydrogenase
MVRRSTKQEYNESVPGPDVDGDRERIEQAVAIAARLCTEGRTLEPSQQRRRAARLARLVGDRAGVVLSLALADEVLRIRDRHRAARRLHDLVATHGAPAGFGPLNRMLLRAGAALAPRLPRLVIPLVEARIRAEADGVVLPAEERPFAAHLARRHTEGLGVNVNVLGEAILGDDEAERRLADVIDRVRRPDVTYVSVKISAICAQLSSLAFATSVTRVSERLRRLYQEAMTATPPVFVNLDMEEHRDLELTVAAFQTVLSEPAFTGLDAGIVLQAYLPDSHDALDELGTWAAARRAAGGGRIKIRVVKGANLLMEQVEAEQRGWEQAPYPTKADVDASWKRLLCTALAGPWGDAVRIGAGSHNLFDVGFALTAADELGLRDRLDIEMLEGMAEGQAKAVGHTLLYAPVVRRTDLDSAIAYLARRLDEQTAPGGFLPKLFDLTVGSPDWVEEHDRFTAAVHARHALSTVPRRTQDRTTGTGPTGAMDPFANEPDTDWSIAANRRWIEAELAAYEQPAEPPLRTTIGDVDAAVATAVAAGRWWGGTTTAERRRVLAGCADAMSAGRGRSLAVMADECGKTIPEGDPEVSEGIDFARYYGHATHIVDAADAVAEPLGVVVVAPPWNFPYAIPAGGVLAALAAGSAVILKPAPEAVLTATVLAEQLWAGGVPRYVLQLLRVPDDEVGRRLITHPDVSTVILTGAAATAELFLGWRPDLRLHAETSGKDAMVITAAADLDLAVKDLVRSAFSHAGQKCSAASLALVERSVLDDGRFLRKLADATRTLRVGPTSDLATDVGPLIHPPSGWLAEALWTLEAGESWLVEPRQVSSDPALWSPGIKLGVRPGSRSHLEEWFGPLLGIIPVDDLDEAIALQNAIPFGLTGGIHTLDPAEVDLWLAGVEVGNAYVNRHTTGAIVRRQPFGGWKRSVVGPAAKAGGPGYVLSLCQWRDHADDRVARAQASYARVWTTDIGVPADPTGLRSEANILRHLPLPQVILRVEEGADEDDVHLCLLAARTTGTPVEVSRADHESSDRLAFRLAVSGATRLRVLGPVPDVLRSAANAAWVHLSDEPPVAEGTVELRRWVREQAISRTLHRYGVITSDPSRAV